ncbi:MAG: hypothetical protein HUJ68_10640 [Clostridia bacterium]|nr:hypothetical protein [Clostridia bacterium]
MKKTKKNYVIIALIVLLLAIAIGYAGFTETLTISGTAKGNADWDINFTDCKFYDRDEAEIVEGEDSDRIPYSLISDDGKTLTVKVGLAFPGDTVCIKPEITNEGEIPAKITSVTATANDDAKGGDGADAESQITIVETGLPETGDELDPDDVCTPEIHITWDEDSELEEFTQTFEITFEYEQNTDYTEQTPAHSHT